MGRRWGAKDRSGTEINMNYDKLCDVLERMVEKEKYKSFHKTEIIMRCRPPWLRASNVNVNDEEDERYFSVRKIVKAHLESCGDGLIEQKEEVQFLREWAKEFEAQAKALRKRAEGLEKSDPY